MKILNDFSWAISPLLFALWVLSMTSNKRARLMKNESWSEAVEADDQIQIEFLSTCFGWNLHKSEFAGEPHCYSRRWGSLTASESPRELLCTVAVSQTPSVSFFLSLSLFPLLSTLLVRLHSTDSSLLESTGLRTSCIKAHFIHPLIDWLIDSEWVSEWLTGCHLDATLRLLVDQSSLFSLRSLSNRQPYEETAHVSGQGWGVRPTALALLLVYNINFIIWVCLVAWLLGG